MQSKQGFVLALTLLLCTAALSVRAQNLPGVGLAEVESTAIFDEIRLNGTVNALSRSSLSTSVAGLVQDVQVDVGDRVERGDVLIQLNDELERHALESARAATQAARAQLQEARRRLTEARTVGAGRNIAQTEVRARESAVATLEAELARMVAEQARQASQVERHRLAAPYSGVISAKTSDLGEWVSPGDALLTLVDIEHLRLDFQVPQDFYPKLNEHTEVLISTSPETAVGATIATAVPVSDPQLRTFLLRARPPAGLSLLPGMSVSATLRVFSGTQGLTVPRDAVNRYPEGRTTVWIAEPDGEDAYRVREQRVDVGHGFANRVVIHSGLNGSEQVVARGNEGLSDGMRVTRAGRESD
ncbi:MexH family multidrug efflux RND transporter periplasmic adaptor subunit [Marinobacterium nitratireducens]|uniref:MexH family multidrug efflux RND transporter periplasmic adaptor subunit n=1 Tax=Marinobacterium nitratireducens TaxID=518897 RepID=A0A918DZ80_9GAMM|nr:efflux RND transporter periplasmic adaptor subunit [Marinobacterium nitratireducens]GGO89386.1 MexH family multidrug efflux RND transporter periplasmic adaptor subunit [Marinobacterium nitratireducens]